MDVLTQFILLGLSLFLFYVLTLKLKPYGLIQYVPAALFVAFYGSWFGESLNALMTYGLLIVSVVLTNLAKRYVWPFRVLTVIYALAIALRLTPSFASIGPVASHTLSELSGDWTIYGGINKALVGLILLPLVPYSRFSVSDIKRNYLILMVGPVGIALLAYWSGLRFDPKFSSFTLVFMFANLCFVVLAEEVFFRGLIQHYICQLLPSRSWAPLGIFMASGIFGIAHIGGGGHFALLAGAAGVVYGIAYWRLRSLWASVYVHLMVNTLHILFLQYPGYTTN